MYARPVVRTGASICKPLRAPRLTELGRWLRAWVEDEIARTGFVPTRKRSIEAMRTEWGRSLATNSTGRVLADFASKGFPQEAPPPPRNPYVARLILVQGSPEQTALVRERVGRVLCEAILRPILEAEQATNHLLNERPSRHEPAATPLADEGAA